MNDPNANHPFVKFLNERFFEVLEREKDNTSHAYFYRCGDYWLAFERSAYVACQQLALPSSEIILLRMAADNSIVPVVWIDDEQKAKMPVNVRIPVRAFNLWKKSLDDYM